jgi:hypothetical protein
MAGSSTEIGDKRGFFQHLTGLYFAPGAEFTAILPKARFLAPLLALLAMNLAFTAVWVQRVDPVEFMKVQNEQSGALDKVPAEQHAAVLSQQAAFVRPMAWISGIAATPILLAVVSATYLLVFRFFLGTELSFKRALAVVTWSFLAVGLVTLPLTLIILFLKGDWSIDPQSALQASLALFLDREVAPRPIYSLADSLNLFSFWVMFLIFMGIRATAPIRPGAAAAGVIAPWAVWVLGKAAVSALL